MIKSLYTPLSGAVAQERVLEIIANNLANLNTVGFKGEKVSFKLLEPEPEKRYQEPLPPANFKVSFDDVLPLKGNDVAYVGVSGVHRDVAQGAAIPTRNKLDMMIEGEGYFSVQTPDGVRYTRAGDFSLNRDGVLVTKQGHAVLGEKGTIVIRNNDFEVNRLGEVYLDGELVDRLALFSFKEPKNLERIGSNYYFYGGPDSGLQEARGNLKQGFLEASNVNAIQNLTAMILAHRSYEAYQKSIKNYDQMMERSNQEIGQVRA